MASVMSRHRSSSVSRLSKISLRRGLSISPIMHRMWGSMDRELLNAVRSLGLADLYVILQTRRSRS